MAAYPQMPGMQTPMMYSQPGAAYYDPSYAAYGSYGAGYAETGAMTSEQKKQAKDAKRQRKIMEANERCEKMREKLREQGKKDASCFLIMMSIAYIGLGSLMGLTIVGPAWGSKEFTGLGAGLVMMKSSLFNLRIDISCDKSFALESYTCNKLMKPFEGDHDLQRAQGNSCALVHSACEVLGRCYIASMPLFGCISLCVLSSFSAAFCLFAYSKSVADPQLRMWAGCFTYLTPFLATTGIVIWAILMPDLGEIPQSWSMLADQFGAGGIIGHQETRDFQFGWTFFAACFIDLCMVISAFVWMCMFKRSEDEEQVIRQKAADQAFCDELEHDRGITMPASEPASYGATGKAAAAAFEADA